MARLRFKSYGQGYPVIILHGLFGSLDNWQSFAKQLAEDYMVFTLDQRDHGRSPHTDEFNYDVLAEDVIGFMDDMWIQEAIIIGHSMGGKVAMRLILDYPDKFKKGIIVDIGPQSYRPRHLEIIEAMRDIDPEAATCRSVIEEELSKTIKDEGIRQFLMKNFSRKKEGGYELKINLPLLMNNYDEINIEIEGDEVFNEILFIKGENSDYLEVEQLDTIKKLFPNAMMTTIDNAGHWIHAEQSEMMLDEVRKFVDN